MKTEFRNWTELIPGAELIPQYATSRNRMYSLSRIQATARQQVVSILPGCHQVDLVDIISI
jgi:hypothetical protein